MSRMEKVNNQIKREIGQIIQRDLADPRLTFVTITYVDVSPDLKNAKVYFSVLGDDKALADAQRGLTGARGAIRRGVSRQMAIRHTPELNFIHDSSISHGSKIEETLKEIHNEQEEDYTDHTG